MRQKRFVQQHESLWDHFEAWLNFLADQSGLRRFKKSKVAQPAPLDLPHAYRQICHHFALANTRLYSPVLLERLNKLVVRGHQRLYSPRSHLLRDTLAYLGGGFASLVRQEKGVVLIALLLFYLPFVSIILAIQWSPELVYSLIDGDQVRQVEAMYDPQADHRLGRERESDSDIYMFGFYIKNNTGIGFQVFAGGLLFGIGTLFFTLFNALFIGAVFGHLTHIGYIDTLYGFVIGHGAFELNAIVFAAAAGLKLSQALIMPGRKSRSRALLDNGRIAVRMMYGVALMFIIAAFIEAFWSSMVMPVAYKYVVGTLLWMLVISYFLFAGRTPRDPVPGTNHPA